MLSGVRTSDLLTGTGRHVQTAAMSVGRLIDRLPAAPKAAGRFVVDAQIARRHRVAAATSPRWRDLEERGLPGGFKNWNDFKEQRDIERLLLPDPALVGLAGQVQRISAENAVRTVVALLQRAWRGWSDEDLWDLDGTLCRTVGGQLTELAAQSNGFPGDGTWGENGDTWVNALIFHGAALTQGRWKAGGEDEAAAEERVRDSLRWVADHHQHLGW